MGDRAGAGARPGFPNGDVLLANPGWILLGSTKLVCLRNVTGNTIAELAAELQERGVGRGKIDAYCSAMGSSGTIAAGERLKQVWSDVRVVGMDADSFTG